MSEFKYIEPITPKTIDWDSEKNKQSELHFNIPLYQRLFEWEDVQIEQLLKDLKEHFNSSQKISPYYIGMMTGNKNGDVVDLVDGQQRFTAMMLMAIVLRKYYPTWESFAIPERLNFSARQDDKSYLDSLINKEKTKEEINYKMLNGLSVIENYLEHHVDDKEAFARNVYEHLTFFVYVLPESYQHEPRKLNKYFEAMNSSGRSLEQHEKVKVDLLKRVKGNVDPAFLNGVWNKAEKLRTRIFEKEDREEGEENEKLDNAIETLKRDGLRSDAIKQIITFEDGGNTMAIQDIDASTTAPKDAVSNVSDNSSVINFQELLLLALSITIGKVPQYDKSTLVDQFREKNFPNDSIEEFYRNLLLVRLLLDRFVIRITKDGNRNRYSLHLDNEGNAQKKVIQYQSMLYVARDQHWLYDFITWLIQQDKAPSAESILEMLKEQDNERHKDKKPSVFRYRGEHGEHGEYGAYWFQRLDYYLWEHWYLNKNKEEKPIEPGGLFKKEYHYAINAFSFSTNRSVEHFHPQNETKSGDWPEEFNGVKDPVHSFGNLALISAGFNSQQSNDSEIVKMSRIREHIREKRLQSLKLLLMYDLAKDNGEVWTPELAERHEKEMMKILNDSFQ